MHLWLIQTRRPGQTRSWYLQSCKFHLQHYLTSGRSVDSAKRRAGQLPWNSNAEDENGFSDGANTENSVLAWVSARDIIALLSRHLLASEKAVLNCLADGLGPREISHRLRISHTMVIKHRRRIAALLTRLETANISLAPIPRVNGVTHRAAISPDNGDKSGGKLGQRE